MRRGRSSVLLRDAAEIGDEEADGFGGDLLGVNAKFGKGRLQRFRKNGFGRWDLIGSEIEKGVGDADAAGGVRRGGERPVDEVSLEVVTFEEVPKGRAVPGGERRWRVRSWILLSQDSVGEGAAAGRQRGPEQFRDERLGRSQHAHDAARDERLEMRHRARVEQRMQELPVGGLPADEKNRRAAHGRARSKTA